MKIGRYDQQIEFWSEGMVSDGYGGYTPKPLLELKTWARIEQLKISADIEQAQLKLPTMYRVGVMAREGFTPSVEHVVRWRGKMYRIVNAPVVESVRYRQEWVFDITAKD